MKQIMLIVSILPLISMAQIKIYNGTYEKGKATYQYYDSNDGNRVYHGTFKYQYEDYSDNYPYQTITGNFKNGKKNGLWKHEYESHSSNFKSRIIKTFYFIDGNLDGECVYNRNFTETKSGKSITTVNYKKTFNYKNGKPSGFFKIEDLYPIKKLYQGYIDSLGFADGEWKIQDEFSEGLISEKPSQKIQCVRIYKNGYLLSSVITDIEKGININDKYFNNTNTKTISDTSLINNRTSNILNIACYDEDGKDRVKQRVTIFENTIEERLCETSVITSTNIHELISRNIPFDFYTKKDVPAFSFTGINHFKQLQKQISKYKKSIDNLTDNISIPYTGTYQFLKNNTKNERYKQLKADTIANLSSTYNALIENIGKLNIVFNSINYASKTNDNIQNSLVEFYNKNTEYLTLFNENSSDKFVNNNLVNRFNNFIDEIEKSAETAYNNFQKPATQLKEIHQQKLKSDSLNHETQKLNEKYKKYIAYYDIKFSDIKKIRIRNKNFSIENTYVTNCSINFKNKLDSITKLIDNTSDIYKKNEYTNNRDEILINIDVFIKKTSEITILICSNLVNSSVVNTTYKTSNKLVFDNVSNSRKINKFIYNEYLPLCFSDINISQNPQAATQIFSEMEKMLIEMDKITDDDDRVKLLKKCKTRNDFVATLL